MCLWGYVLVDLYGCMSVFCVGLCRRKSACMCFCVHTCVLHVQAWFGVYLVVCVSIPRQSVCGELCVWVHLDVCLRAVVPSCRVYAHQGLQVCVCVCVCVIWP